MKKLIRRARIQDPEAGALLRIIDVFDQLAAAQSGLEKLARMAARLSSRTVWIDDGWNGRRLRTLADGTLASEADLEADEDARAVMTAIVGHRLRGRRSAAISTEVGEILGASLEVASGRVGAVWFERGDRKFTTADYVVAERLAAAVISDALTTHAQTAARSRVDRAAVERLLVTELSAEAASLAAKEAQLPASRVYVAIAIAERPRASTSPDASGQIVARAISAGGLAARPCVVGAASAVIAESGPGLGEILTRVAKSSGRLGYALEFGVGEAGPVEALNRSWRQARESLVLRSLAAPDRPVAFFPELGLLHLFAQIPAEEVARFPDYVSVAALASGAGSPSDLELLDVYCDTGSLRATAAQLYLHFTTVHQRLARIESTIGLRLANPADRFRIHVAVKLVQIHQVSLLDEALTSPAPAHARERARRATPRTA